MQIIDKVTVLEQGYVRFVDSMGSDSAIVRAARVSYDRDRKTGTNPEEDAKLIRYLMRNKHTSPFEACQLNFEIKCPLFIARQWHRHRTWSYNEISARYAELDEGYYLPDPQLLGNQSSDNKQMREIEDNVEDHVLFRRKILVQRMQHSIDNSIEMYKKLLKAKVPRELARSVLPSACFTRYYGSVNLHNLFHFLRLRLHEHAQYEIRVYAEAILTIIDSRFPIAVEAFKETL